MSSISQPTERIEAEVCTLAAQLAAATCRFVQLVAELDRREAWAEWGCRSMAHWLSWKCGMGLVPARQHMRVFLESPSVGAGCNARGRGRARRVRTKLHGVATRNRLRWYAHTRTGAAAARQQLDRRRYRVIHHDDGDATLVVRMPRDTVEALSHAIEAAREDLPRDRFDDSAESQRVDALEAIARHFLAGTSDRVPTEVVIHADVDELTTENPSPVLERMLCDTAVRAHVKGRRR